MESKPGRSAGEGAARAPGRPRARRQAGSAGAGAGTLRAMSHANWMTGPSSPLLLGRRLCCVRGGPLDTASRLPAPPRVSCPGGQGCRGSPPPLFRPWVLARRANRAGTRARHGRHGWRAQQEQATWRWRPGTQALRTASCQLELLPAGCCAAGAGAGAEAGAARIGSRPPGRAPSRGVKRLAAERDFVFAPSLAHFSDWDGRCFGMR